jgi:hypothetical protein
VNVDTTDNYGTGTKKLLDLSTTTVVSGTPNIKPQFVVNDKGYMSTDGFMYKIITAPASSATCSSTSPTVGQSVDINSTYITNDFGNGYSYTIASETVAQVVFEPPAIGSITTSAGATAGFAGFSGLLYNGTQAIEVMPGISVKRLAAGTWRFLLSCRSTMGGTGTVYTTFGTGGVFSIRRFH